MDSIFQFINFIFAKFTPEQILGIIKLTLIVIPVIFFLFLFLRLGIIWTTTKEDDTFWVQKVQPKLNAIISFFEIYKIPQIKIENESLRNELSNLRSLVAKVSDDNIHSEDKHESDAAK